ncbi:MAG: protein kinase family protein [Firmicutes bacterium]|nr:protein kinase family protein [Bacillota bacterium]
MTKDNEKIMRFVKYKDYKIVKDNLGSGSFGKTVLLQDETLDELFVAKKYEPDDDEDKEKFYNSFVQEIKIMHRLYHKNLVRIFSYYLYPEIFSGHIIMEYINGQPIDKFFSILEKGDGSIAGAIFLQILDAFDFLEQNKILHRDIRENNILIDKYGMVKIIDFGLGKIISQNEITVDKPKTKGKNSMAAVINRNNMVRHPYEFYDGKYTHQTDMFCIAELINRMLENETKIANFSYKKILDKMMMYNASDRYKTFGEIIDEVYR